MRDLADDRGNVVLLSPDTLPKAHAIVEDDAEAVPADELHAFLEERVVRYEIPRSFEFVDQARRDDAGKVGRSALRADRLLR